MRNEILKGIAIGLLCIVTVVSAGAFVGFSLSDYEPSAEAQSGADTGANDTAAEGAGEGS